MKTKPKIGVIIFAVVVVVGIMGLILPFAFPISDDRVIGDIKTEAESIPVNFKEYDPNKTNVIDEECHEQAVGSFGVKRNTCSYVVEFYLSGLNRTEIVSRLSEKGWQPTVYGEVASEVEFSNFSYQYCSRIWEIRDQVIKLSCYYQE